MATLGLSCGTWDLSLWQAGSFVVVHRFSSLWHTGSRAHGFSSCGVWAQLPHGTWDRSSLTRDRTCIPWIGRRILNHWTTREVPILTFF